MNLTTYWECTRCHAKHEIMTQKDATRVGAMITITPHYIREVFVGHFCKVCSYPMSEALLVAALVTPEPTIVDEYERRLLE